MGCISVILSKVGAGIKTTMTRIAGMSVRVDKMNSMTANMVKVGGIATNMAKIGGIQCEIYPVCSVDVRGKYLEIEPTILWIWNDPMENNVYSNTNWNVE